MATARPDPRHWLTAAQPPHAECLLPVPCCLCPASTCRVPCLCLLTTAHSLGIPESALALALALQKTTKGTGCRPSHDFLSWQLRPWRRGGLRDTPPQELTSTSHACSPDGTHGTTHMLAPLRQHIPDIDARCLHPPRQQQLPLPPDNSPVCCIRSTRLLAPVHQNTASRPTRTVPMPQQTLAIG